MTSSLLLLELDRASKTEVGDLDEALAVEEEVAGLKDDKLILEGITKSDEGEAQIGRQCSKRRGQGGKSGIRPY